ncbi:hypothetical protein R3P38DRAFT_3512190 [Favolaschia claudopus]|uniref:Uncharacterized protein n=1 Tax=Favolaschia claudopus TaxID=2862362 RepID=A0AAV9Z0W0_9AGAR
MRPRPSSSSRSPDAISETKPLHRPKHTIAVCPARLMYWLPAFTRLQRMILFGHFALQLTAWTLFGLIWSKQIITIPLPDFFHDVQSWYKPLTFFVTAISSGLALFSTLLFSLAVRQWISSQLRTDRGLRLTTFLRSMHLASHSLILDRGQHGLWMTASIIVIILIALQPAGWNTLLTPQLFDLDNKVSSKEIDLANPRLDLYLHNGSLDACALDNSVLVGLAIGETESGFSAARGAQNLPSSLSIANFIFNTSTAGILPLSFQDIPTSSAFDNATIIPHSISGPGIGIPRSLSMVQQGFTADVSCKFQPLTNTTSPSLTITTLSPHETSAPTQYNISSDCPMPINLGNTTRASTYALAERDAGYLLMIACANDASYTLIFIGGGDQYAYLNSTVCTFTPKITNVRVDYHYLPSASSNTTGNFPARIDTTPLPSGIPDFIGGPAGISALATVYEMIRFAQGEEMNVVGDQLIGVLESVDGEGFVEDGEGVLRAMEEYLRGVAEYSGTLLRACLSSHKTSGIFADGIPQEMTTPTTGGELRTYFFGWALTPSTVWILVPGALIALASIALVLCSAAADVRLSPEDSGLFDPVDAFELIRASAVGGLAGVFKLGSEDGSGAITKGEPPGDVRVVLEMIPGRGMALIGRVGNAKWGEGVNVT